MSLRSRGPPLTPPPGDLQTSPQRYTSVLWVQPTDEGLSAKHLGYLLGFPRVWKQSFLRSELYGERSGLVDSHPHRLLVSMIRTGVFQTLEVHDDPTSGVISQSGFQSARCPVHQSRLQVWNTQLWPASRCGGTQRPWRGGFSGRCLSSTPGSGQGLQAFCRNGFGSELGAPQAYGVNTPHSQHFPAQGCSAFCSRNTGFQVCSEAHLAQEHGAATHGSHVQL